MEIKRPKTEPRAPLTARDRESLDFGRLLAPPKAGGPTPGLSYSKLLEIATDVCGITVTADLSQIRTKQQVKKIKERIKRSYYSA